MSTTTRTRSGNGRPPVLASYRLTDDPRVTLAGLIESIPVGDNGSVWLSQTKRLQRHTIVGVPGKQITICIDPRDPTPGSVWVCRVTRKRGRHDGTERVELLVGHWRSEQCATWDEGGLRITIDGGRAACRITTDETPSKIERDRCDLWHGVYDRLKSDLAGYHLPAIIEWHRHNYYRMLSYRDCEDTAAAFVASVQPHWTLAEANRLASRMLYALARDCGWRKLTTREQEKYGVSGQWHRVSTLDAVVVQQAPTPGTAPGVGEYTASAATGRVPIYGRDAIIAAAEDYADRNGLSADIRKHLPPDVFAVWLRERSQTKYADAVEGVA